MSLQGGTNFWLIAVCYLNLLENLETLLFHSRQQHSYLNLRLFLPGSNLYFSNCKWKNGSSAQDLVSESIPFWQHNKYCYEIKLWKSYMWTAEWRIDPFLNCISCAYNCDDLPSNNSSLRSSHIWFSYIHNFIIILSRVYNEPIQWPAPSWLVSLIGRALHWYRRGQGFESRTSLNFFRLSFLNCISCVYNCNDLPSNKYYANW